MNATLLRIMLMTIISMFSQCGLAQVNTTVDDANVLFKFEIVDKVHWVFSTDIDSDRGGSISCAVTPNGVEPLTTICVTTKIAANDLAVKMPALGVAQQKVFLKGVCISHKCRDTSGVVDSEEFV